MSTDEIEYIKLFDLLLMYQDGDSSEKLLARVLYRYHVVLHGKGRHDGSVADISPRMQCGVLSAPGEDVFSVMVNNVNRNIELSATRSNSLASAAVS